MIKPVSPFTFSALSKAKPFSAPGHHTVQFGASKRSVGPFSNGRLVSLVIAAIVGAVGALTATQQLPGTSSESAQSTPASATIVQTVHDGDTFTLTNGMKIRLNRGVDALELKQKDGDKAQQLLASLVASKPVILSCKDVTYDRNLCWVQVSDPETGEIRDVNLAMLQGGYAFLDPRYADDNPDKARYQNAFDEAKRNQVGACAGDDGCGQTPLEYRCEIRPNTAACKPDKAKKD